MGALRWLGIPLAVGVAGAALTAGTAPARAQSTTGFAWPTEWMVGGVVLTQPKFEGSKDYTFIGFPFIAPGGFTGSGFVNIIDAENVQFRLLRFGSFEAGPLVGYRFGRD